ncbi:MAG: flagellar protein FlgN [Calditrichaeota bacterium]|nr:MAG: flagellar protein FlgN [Calditrichota bacterium]
MNSKQMNELFSLLLEETSTYENLGELARSKQKALVDGEIVKINQYSAMENAMLKKVERISTARMRLVDELMPPEDEAEIHTLNAFIVYHQLDKQPEWLSMKERLENAVRNLRRLNHENAMLIQTSVRLMQDLVNWCYPNAGEDHSIYTRDGQVRTPDHPVVNYGA